MLSILVGDPKSFMMTINHNKSCEDFNWELWEMAGVLPCMLAKGK